jgi:hypothetical protein
VLIYAGAPIDADADADAGQLDEWAEQVKGNPDQLDRFVFRAFYSGLLDHAKLRRRNGRECRVPLLGGIRRVRCGSGSP